MEESILREDFKEFIQLLNEKKVEYLVVGGYAVALHGYIRTTKDIDFWISCTFENAERILVVLKEFGFGSPGITLEDFTNKDNTVQLGYPPFRIDILNDIDGVEFDECFQRKIEIEVDGITLNLIDLESLKKTKEQQDDIKI